MRTRKSRISYPNRLPGGIKGLGLIPDWGTRIPQALSMTPPQKKKRKASLFWLIRHWGVQLHTACLTLFSFWTPWGHLLFRAQGLEGWLVRGGWPSPTQAFALSGPQLPPLLYGQKQPSLLACCEQLGEQNAPWHQSRVREGAGRSCNFTKKSRHAKSLSSVKMPTPAICQWAVCTHNTFDTKCAMSSPVLNTSWVASNSIQP